MTILLIKFVRRASCLPGVHCIALFSLSYSLLKCSNRNRPVEVVKCVWFDTPSLDVSDYVVAYLQKTLIIKTRAVAKGLPKPKQLFLSYSTGNPYVGLLFPSTFWMCCNSLGLMYLVSRPIRPEEEPLRIYLLGVLRQHRLWHREIGKI